MLESAEDINHGVAPGVEFGTNRREWPPLTTAGSEQNPSRASHPIFAPEHSELRSLIHSFVTKEIAPFADEWEETTFPDSIFRRMGELGFLGLDKPVALGGQGGDYLCAVVLAEEMAYGASNGLSMAVAVHTDMVLPPLLEFGSTEQVQEWAVPAIRGDSILCLGITEPEAGSDIAGIKTNARKQGADWIINGTKTYITNGIRADLILLVTKTEPELGQGGFTLFLVPLDTPGVSRSQRLHKLGMKSSDTAILTFEDVRVPESAVLGEIGRGFAQIMWQLQGERLCNCAGMLAMANRALDLAMEYVKQRYVFGKPLSEMQVTRHRVARMAAELAAARELTYRTVERFAKGEYPVLEISMAKYVAAQTANRVVDDCLQLFGGAGYMNEYPIERLWRDLRLHRIGGGSDEVMLEIVSKRLNW